MGVVQQQQNETANLSAHSKSLNIVTGKTEAMTFKQHCPKTLKSLTLNASRDSTEKY